LSQILATALLQIVNVADDYCLRWPMTNFVYISQMIRGLASRKVQLALQLAEIFWRYKALQVNLDHAHTALPDQTSPKPAPHQRYLAVLLSLCAHCVCLLLHVATQCAPYVEVLARITSSEYPLSNQAKVNLFLLCRRSSSPEHFSPLAASCTFSRPVHNFQSTDEGTWLLRDR
jgi:hypothetical protein